MGSILRKVVSAHKTDWDNKLALAVYSYNTIEKTTIEKSPYYMVYGQSPLSILGLDLSTTLTLRDEPIEEDGMYIGWKGLKH